MRRTCPGCRRKEPDFYQILGVTTVYVRGVRTLGQQAEYNSKKAGHEAAEKRAAAEEASKEAADNAWFRPTKKPLNLKKISNVQRYIEEGRM